MKLLNLLSRFAFTHLTSSPCAKRKEVWTLIFLFSCWPAFAVSQKVMIQCESVGPVFSGTIDFPQFADCTPAKEKDRYGIYCAQVASLEFDKSNSHLKYVSASPLEILPTLWPSGGPQNWDANDVTSFKKLGFPGLSEAFGSNSLFYLNSQVGYPIFVEGTDFTADGKSMTGFIFGAKGTNEICVGHVQ